MIDKIQNPLSNPTPNKIVQQVFPEKQMKTQKNWDKYSKNQ